MKIIDLLNKIANGEEVPKKIIYKDIVREFDYEDKDYTCKGDKDYYLFHDTLAEGTGDKMVTGLNDEIEIIEDTPKEDKKIKDKARFQYSQIPLWFDMKEFIRVVNDNFERHQKALNEIIDKINKGV